MSRPHTLALLFGASLALACNNDEDPATAGEAGSATTTATIAATRRWTFVMRGIFANLQRFASQVPTRNALPHLISDHRGLARRRTDAAIPSKITSDSPTTGVSPSCA